MVLDGPYSAIHGRRQIWQSSRSMSSYGPLMLKTTVSAPCNESDRDRTNRNVVQ